MDALIGFIVAQKYQIENKIGKGSFGEIYQATNLQTGMKVGIKVEQSDHAYPQLLYESRIYDSLRGGPGIPYLYWYGSESIYNFLVMDLLGLSFEALLDQCNRQFSLKTLLQIADQMVTRIEYLHTNYYIHRDIKPENFVIGLGDRCNLIYVIDYGLCKKYMNHRTGDHIQYIEGKALTGTARYVSISTHIGIEQSRRDDLEGLAYVLVYLGKGKLPWQDLGVVDKNDRYEAIKNMKMRTSTAELCEGIPREFRIFLEYARSLGFEETPNYTYLKELFRDLMIKSRFELDYNFDWDIPIETKSVKPKKK